MTDFLTAPDAANDYHAGHAALLLRSHRYLTGRDLLPPGATPAAAARALYCADFVVLSHNTEADPRFTYANRAAQRLFAMPWGKIVGLHSRYSAAAPVRDERQRLLERVARDGYIDDYSGVRIAATGARFLIAQATVWNLIGDDGAPAGQAASFARWTPLAADA
jgi:hypothetical protein